jgi:hypothetical protein
MGITTGNDPSANLMRLLVEQVTVSGTIMGTREDMNNLIQFVISTGIKPAIGQVLPMEKAREGFRAMVEGRTSRLNKISTFTALRNPVYRKLWFAILLSGTCVAAQDTAATWTMNMLGSSTFLLSLISTVGTRLPTQTTCY